MTLLGIYLETINLTALAFFEKMVVGDMDGQAEALSLSS